MARKRPTPPTAEPVETPTPHAPEGRLVPPEGGATVRMYRSGHGDCFLLAFAGDSPEKISYVLIDCGYKPGSPKFIDTKIADIAKHIHQATGGHLDVAVITHEHQDHVNGITAANFNDFTIGETWLAWTEDPSDALANSLRVQFKDKLLGLLGARNTLAAAGDDRARRIDEFLEFELGGDDDAPFNPIAAGAMLGAAGGPGRSMNKQSMKIFKDKAQNGVKYLRPHEEVRTLPGAKHVRVFALGPPRDVDRLEDLDPQGDEEFHSLRLASASPGNYFAAAAAGASSGFRTAGGLPPFARRYQFDYRTTDDDSALATFFKEHYGRDGLPSGFASGGPNRGRGSEEVHDNPDWRRIDHDWLAVADQLALDMNDATNNASLVLAFELGKGGKVLLFAADAQRGNWASWALHDWKDGREVVTTRDLLGRTVLYKVGHHGSHNATLNGKAQDEVPNLSWMASGDHAREFTAMITAVRAWAETQKGWDHPRKEIKDALLRKASGRVFQTDTDLTAMTMPPDASPADWDRFQSRVHGERLFFDVKVTP